MTEQEVEMIADRAAEKALEKVFMSLGLDLTTPTGVREAQDDFRYMRFMRELQTHAGSQALYWVIRIVVGGLVLYIGSKVFGVNIPAVLFK